MQEKKPRWDKPKLIVITRGDRQERVLANCKTTGAIPEVMPYHWFGPCFDPDVCIWCEAQAQT